MFTPSPATARRRFPAGALFDVALAAVTLAGSMALVRHGGVGPIGGVATADLDLVGVGLAACSAVPLVAWRRFPLEVFTVTAASGVLLTGLGHRIDLLLGPAVALYLLAARREHGAPWTRRTTLIVAGMFVAYLGATILAQRSFPVSELLHTGLAWAVAWFAGERTRLRVSTSRS